jgi:hypothetical protein
MATSSLYYIDSSSFNTAVSVYTNQELTNKAPDGYYSIDGLYRKQVFGKLETLLSCTSTPPPSGYKIRSFNSGQNIYNSPCLGDEQWNTSENYITIQLVEEDGVTPKINNTGANVVISLRYEETGCITDTFIRDAIIAPGESEIVVVDRNGVAACPECINTSETISCYESITPSNIIPTEFFFIHCEDLNT